MLFMNPHQNFVSPVLGSVVFVVFLAACSTPRPVLYPNAHLKTVGEEQAKQDIAACEAMADQHVKSSGAGQVAGSTAVGAGVGAASGAVGGAVSGSAGAGAAIGAAAGATSGFLRGLFRSSQPSRTYMKFVNKCLEEKGYEPTGWD